MSEYSVCFDSRNAYRKADFIHLLKELDKQFFFINFSLRMYCTDRPMVQYIPAIYGAETTKNVGVLCLLWQSQYLEKPISLD